MALLQGSFLRDPDVRSFRTFVRGFLREGSVFAHSYYHYGTESNWECTSLIDAAGTYRWGINPDFHPILVGAGIDIQNQDFAANQTVLLELQKELREAYILGPQTRLLTCILAVFKWGNTVNGNAATAAAIDLDPGMRPYIHHCHQTFGAGAALDATSFDSLDLRCNAGYTKVYSLLFDDFIIYDSRVAAALGLLVALWCVTNCKEEVPQSLQFVWMPAKSYLRKVLPARHPLRRDPSVVYGELPCKHSLWFPRRGASALSHIQSNMRASWLLTSAIYEDPTPADNVFLTIYGGNALRALEAALFMIGYDLTQASLPAHTSWLPCYKRLRTKTSKPSKLGIQTNQ